MYEILYNQVQEMQLKVVSKRGIIIYILEYLKIENLKKTE